MDEIIWEDRPSWKGYYISLTLFALLTIYGFISILFSYQESNKINESIIFIGVAIVLKAYLNRLKFKYIITPTRITEKYGLFTTITVEVDLRYIRSILLSQNIIQKMLNIGNIEFLTVMGSTNDIYIKNIDNPQEIKEIIYQYKERAMNNRY